MELGRIYERNGGPLGYTIWLGQPYEKNSESKGTIVNGIATTPRDRRTIKVHSLLIEEEMPPGTGVVLAGKVVCCSWPNLY